MGDILRITDPIPSDDSIDNTIILSIVRLREPT